MLRKNHYSDNLNDHLPVSVEFNLFLNDFVTKNSEYLPASINWEGLTDDNKMLYAEIMERNLNSINIPFHDLFHGKRCCDCSNHIFLIKKIIY